MASPVIDTGTTLDFDAMTISQLRAEAVRLAAVLTLCNDQRKLIFEAVEKRKALAIAQQKVGTLTNTEKDAFRTVLGSG